MRLICRREKLEVTRMLRNKILFWADRSAHRIFKRVGDSPVTRVGRVQPVAERMREKLARSRS